MGQQVVKAASKDSQLRKFTQFVLKDLHALEVMLEEGLVEADKQRIGVEQELVLVDRACRPMCVAHQVLAELDDPRFTPELASFNLEFSTDPMSFAGSCLTTMEEKLNAYLSQVREAAAKHQARAMMIGILPTIRKKDLVLENMTQSERYAALNEALTRMRGTAYDLNIKGTDELILKHDNVMLEAANTSFQVHFQVAPDEFAQRYNIAQVAAAPVLAAAVNSPFLGRFRLWKETRIAVFQQSLDTRTAPFERELSPRVHFGNKWVDESVLEIFQEDIARYKVLFAIEIDEDPFKQLKANKAPALQALCLHNSTVYRWNRVCYGIAKGKAHLRIENRVLPSGPTVVDEVANAAFWFGLMEGMSQTFGDVTKVISFDNAKDNFFAAARHGLGAQLEWIDDTRYTARDLILDQLVAMARKGLVSSGIDSGDIDKYLGIIESRVEQEQTGAQWMLGSYVEMKPEAPVWGKLNAVTAATINRQEQGDPVHQWRPAKLEEGGGWESYYLQVEQYMTSDLITVQPHEPIDLVALLMVWNRIRHVLVENEQHELLGIVSHRRLLRLIGRPLPKREGRSAPVSSIMVTEPITITPETRTLDAIRLMRRERISCLPVINEGKLVGVVTEDNFLSIAGDLLEQGLTE